MQFPKELQPVRLDGASVRVTGSLNEVQFPKELQRGLYKYETEGTYTPQ